MTQLTGQCLCGDVTFKADGDINVMVNCHCKDCQHVTGAAYATLVFMSEDDIKITGELKSYAHSIENGNVLTKQFCARCGSQMFGTNAARPGGMALRAGSINEQEHVKPQFNVFASGKLDCTILDDTIPAFDKMPG